MSYERDYRSLPSLLTTSKELVSGHFRPVISQYGISEQFWRVMRGAYENPHITIDEICDKWQIVRPAVGGLLKHMQEKDLLTLNYESELNEPLITLTEKSICMIKEITPVIDKEYRKLEDKYGKELIEKLFYTLEEIVQIDEAIKTQTMASSTNVYKFKNEHRSTLN